MLKSRNLCPQAMNQINIHPRVQTCKMAENKLSVVSDTTNLHSDAGSSNS